MSQQMSEPFFLDWSKVDERLSSNFILYTAVRSGEQVSFAGDHAGEYERGLDGTDRAWVARFDAAAARWLEVNPQNFNFVEGSDLLLSDDDFKLAKAQLGIPE
jgi:hypothetical protein